MRFEGDIKFSSNMKSICRSALLNDNAPDSEIQDTSWSQLVPLGSSNFSFYTCIALFSCIVRNSALLLTQGCSVTKQNVSRTCKPTAFDLRRNMRIERKNLTSAINCKDQCKLHKKRNSKVMESYEKMRKIKNEKTSRTDVLYLHINIKG